MAYSLFYPGFYFFKLVFQLRHFCCGSQTTQDPIVLFTEPRFQTTPMERSKLRTVKKAFAVFFVLKTNLSYFQTAIITLYGCLLHFDPTFVDIALKCIFCEAILKFYIHADRIVLHYVLHFHLFLEYDITYSQFIGSLQIKSHDLFNSILHSHKLIMIKRTYTEI